MTIKQITENTAIPISMVIVITGAILWAARLEGKVNAQEQVTNAIPATLEKVLDTQMQIDRRLSRIEGRLGRTK